MCEAHARKFYGRRKGKSLRQQQAQRLEVMLPVYAVPQDVPSSLWMEIGFGGGEHLFHLSKFAPDTHIIGCEPFQNGVVKLLTSLYAEPRNNISIHMGDARNLLDKLPCACLQRVYLLYPDPWPKLRHQKRRFISQDNLSLLARVMAPASELRFATDIVHYVKTALQHVDQHPHFEVKAPPSTCPWRGWYRTRYEEKALREGRQPTYTIFQRV